MASSLFQLAQKALQVRASRSYQSSPVGRASAFVKVWSSSKRKAPEIERALGNQNAQRLIRDLASAMEGQSPERYSNRASGLMNQLLDALGPLGEAIKLAVGGRGRYTDQLESAVALIRALGGEYLTMDRGSPHYQRGLQAARKVLGATGGGPSELSPHEVMDRLNEINQELDAGGSGNQPPGGGPTTGEGDEWPDEHGIQILGRDSASYDPEAMELILNREFKTPESSNVYSFVYEEETDPKGRFQERSGILYVTFRPWYPGMKYRPNGPGPMYAYFDVPWRKYKAFEAAATNHSAGGAVWEYLRVKGSKWDHRFPYRLVGGVQVPAGGVYVPRKVTQWGLRRRSLPTPGTGRRGFVRSSLPERAWMPNRGEPNRGGPNRGEPNRGQ